MNKGHYKKGCEACLITCVPEKVVSIAILIEYDDNSKKDNARSESKGLRSQKQPLHQARAGLHPKNSIVNRADVGLHQ